jgi:Arc/MetJ-type ribon-helix-helix transcriptional regulator
MNLPLPPAQIAWLEAQVATGRFASLEEALASAVAQLQAQDEIDDGWAKPLIDEALEELDRGEGTPWRKGEALEKVKARRASGA